MHFFMTFLNAVLKVYFASVSRKTIERVDLNGGSRDVLVSVGLDSPEGLAVDWVHRTMYWTDKGWVGLNVEDESWNDCFGKCWKF